MNNTIKKLKHKYTNLCLNINEYKKQLHNIAKEKNNIKKTLITFSSKSNKNKHIRKLNYKNDILLDKLLNAKKDAQECKNKLSNLNRKNNKLKTPIRNKYTKRVNNNQLVSKYKYKKYVQKRKQECKKYKFINKKNYKKRGILNNNSIIKTGFKFKYKKPKFENINQLIKDITYIIKSLLQEINAECFSYDRNIHLHDLFFAISKKVSNSNMSMINVNQELKNKNICYTSTSALNKKRDKLNYEHLKFMYNEMKSIFTENINEYSKKTKIDKPTYSADGSKSTFYKNHIEDKFNTDKYNKVNKALLSCVYDNHNEVPLDIELSNSMNEPKILEKQLDLLEEGSLLMADGSYVTKNVINKIFDKKLFCIFKMRRNLKISKEFLKIDDHEKIYEYEGRKLRLIKYKINKEVFILGTNLCEDYNKETIIELYNQRWFIEEFFKTLKCTFNLKHTKSTKYNNIMQELYMQLIIALITKYIEIMSPMLLPIKKNHNNYKIIRTNMHFNIANKFLYLIFYKKLTIKQLSKISNLIFDLINEIYLILDNRYNKRFRTKPPTEYINKINYDIT